MNTIIELPTRPLPGPPTLLPQGDVGQVFDVISEKSKTHYAWVIRDSVSGVEELIVRKRPRGGSVLVGLADHVTSMIEARRISPVVMLRCHTEALRHVLRAVLPEDRFTLVDLVGLSPARDWSTAARTRLHDELWPREEGSPKGILYAASDGSIHPVLGGGACAWVTHDGTWLAGRTRSDILRSELSAISSFAFHLNRSLIEGHSKAVLFVDSLSAIRAVNRRDSMIRGLTYGDADVLYRMLDRKLLELVWTRSHQDHLLNDVADRLALMRHRAIRSNLTKHQIREQGDRIVENSLPDLVATDWGKVTRECRSAWARHRAMHPELTEQAKVPA